MVAYAISRQIDTELTLAAVKAAVNSSKPPPGCIHHSDRGSQYASDVYHNALQQFGMRGSKSPPATPCHNAQANSLMKALEVEQAYIAGQETFAEVTERFLKFFEEVYNTKRMHSALGYRAPNASEAQFTQQAA